MGNTSAAIKIQCREAMFRIGMTSQMRFTQQVKSGDTSSAGELIPHWRADYMQLQIVDYLIAQAPHDSKIAKAFGMAIQCVDDPFTTDDAPIDVQGTEWSRLI
jgi:hypothetical protein